MDCIKTTLRSIGLQEFADKFAALGVKSAADFDYVDDSDLVTWGLTTIQRRRFFRWREEHNASCLCDANVSLNLPEQQLLEMSIRILTQTGPQHFRELKRKLMTHDGAGLGRCGITDLDLFNTLSACAAFEVSSASMAVLQPDLLPDVFVALKHRLDGEVIFTIEPVCCRIIEFVGLQPVNLFKMSMLCKSSWSCKVWQSSAQWHRMLKRWYPQAVVEDPAAVCNAKARVANDRSKSDAMVKHLQDALPTGTAIDFVALHKASQSIANGSDFDPAKLLLLLSKHPAVFKQQVCHGGGVRFCVAPPTSTGDWEAVNPYQDLSSLHMDLDGNGDGVIPDMSKPKMRMDQASGSSTSIHPQAVFRYWHTGLLRSNPSGERAQRGKQGTRQASGLHSWEYLSESNVRAVRPASELLDEAESSVQSIRNKDPENIHDLVHERLDGIVYHMDGCYNRRVQILANALQGGELKMERPRRKTLERKLLEYMEHVRSERAFGYYYCSTCKSRWKSGFSYEEMGQQCFRCKTTIKPFRVTGLSGHAPFKQTCPDESLAVDRDLHPVSCEYARFGDWKQEQWQESKIDHHQWSAWQWSEWRAEAWSWNSERENDSWACSWWWR